jgi:hypothetical protein
MTALTGTGIYEGKPKIEELRVIANLFPESVQAAFPNRQLAA